MACTRLRDGAARWGRRSASESLSGRAVLWLVVCAAIWAVVGVLGCVPKQRVPLDITPIATHLYLDGEPVDGMPRELKLRSDQDHTLFFKSEGHRPELVVLRSSLHQGKPRLEPAGVHLRLAPLDPKHRQLVIEGGGKKSASPDARAEKAVASPSPGRQP